ncbi:Pcmt1-prov protein [Flagelloscypha sp. PMI_526]|nr:Pcmt1-prov protein [Flagelloscypha sp. PMI_526]
MAWRCSGQTNKELISNMRKASILTSDTVATAMKFTDRANYVRFPQSAYEDSPQTIGHGATISAPHMHAYACEHLLPYLSNPGGSRVLDIGSGSGYLSAVLWRLVSEAAATGEPSNAKVVGIEHIPQLTEWSKDNLRKDGLEEEMKDRRIIMMAGDGRLGFQEGGPYQAIHVGAAAPVVPQALIDQLASPGRMFIPVGADGGEQYIYHYDKDAQGNLTTTRIMGVRYVPLTDKPND